MSEEQFEERFLSDLLSRTRSLREARGWSQAQMAEALGVSLARYKKYETRSPLPHHLIPRFAMLVGKDIEYVLCGTISAALKRYG